MNIFINKHLLLITKIFKYLTYTFQLNLFFPNLSQLVQQSFTVRSFLSLLLHTSCLTTSTCTSVSLHFTCFCEDAAAAMTSLCRVMFDSLNLLLITRKKKIIFSYPKLSPDEQFFYWRCKIKCACTNEHTLNGVITNIKWILFL